MKHFLKAPPLKLFKFTAKGLHRIHHIEAKYKRLPELCHQRCTNIAPLLYTTGQLVNQIPQQYSPINYNSCIGFQLEGTKNIQRETTWL
jgi:hypothetical protein